jgi:hypothetical protein
MKCTVYCREKQLLVSLYVFVCRFVSVAPILWISLIGYIWELHDYLLGKPSLVKISPKFSLCLLEDLSVIQGIRRHYIAIKALCFRKKLVTA